MGGKDRQSEADEPRVSGISRRKFVAGSLFLVGGSSMLVDSETTATFRDSVSASGTVAVDGDPTLNYQIIDRSKNSNAEYQIAYQVEWVDDFDYIWIGLDNVENGVHDTNPSNGNESETFTSSNPEGVFTTPGFGGHEEDTFEFFFEVYEEDNTTPIIEKIVTDLSGDGTGSGEGDFSDGNSPAFDWVGITDDTDNSGAKYGVYYGISNQDEAASIEATFENADENTTDTESSTDLPEGAFNYSDGGASGDSFEITVELVNTNGVVVDSVSFEDVADRDNPETYGDPTSTDTPTFEWVLIRDNTDSEGAKYDVYYEVTDGNDFDSVTATFDNVTDGSAGSRSTPDTPTGTMAYSQGGADGDSFDIAVEANNAVGYPVDTVTFADDADTIHPNSYGDSSVSDSPTLDSFTLTDTSENSNTNYELSYETSNEDRFGGARILFKDTEKTSATKSITTGTNETNGTVEYSAGGTEDDLYEITVEVLEIRDGTTFPVDSGTLEDVAGDGPPKSWPADAN